MKNHIYEYCKSDEDFAAYFDSRINSNNFLLTINKNSLQNISGIIYRYICIVDESNIIPLKNNNYNMIILSTLYL